MFGEIALAGGFETAARFGALAHREGQASHLGNVVLHADIVIDGGLGILELIIPVASREIAEGKIAGGAGLLAFAQGERGQFDGAGRGIELGDAGQFEQAGEGPFDRRLGAQIAAVRYVARRTGCREQRLVRLAESEGIFFDRRLFEIGKLSGHLKLNIGAVHFV